jgi:hypothetical protein
MNDETCPKCGAHFPADRAWANRSIAMLAIAPGWQDLDTRVRCPTCSTVFPAREFRYFGFLPPTAMRTVVLGGVAAIAILAVAFWFSAP